MSRFLDFLKEEMESTPGQTNNATAGNVSQKFPLLKHTPGQSDEEVEDPDKFDDIDDLIEQNHITFDRKTVETIIALVQKTLDDYNRNKKLDGEQIVRIIDNAISYGIINIK